jgi:hypothetical protein
MLWHRSDPLFTLRAYAELPLPVFVQLLDSLTSNDELALLAAEYSLLNEQLSYVALEASDAACLLNQDGAQQLEALSREIPDLRSRLDIG